mgnify:CR=1 FL=1
MRYTKFSSYSRRIFSAYFSDLTPRKKFVFYIFSEKSPQTNTVNSFFGISFKENSIGRVVISNSYRGLGLGKKLMEASIEGCYEKFGKGPIRIGAQYHLSKFYQSLGFIEQGKVYDEDGIPHIGMLRA